jgi:hypothetical protein
MNQSPLPVPETDTQSIPRRRYSRRRVINGLSTTLIGLFLFLLGARPSVFGLDRSPVVGFVQVAVFLVGLAVICVGGFISLLGLWKKEPMSILADIGVRMVATGYVMAVFSGMADVFGFGSQIYPETPFFGQLQALGVTVGELIIAIGLLFLIPYHRIFGNGKQ